MVRVCINDCCLVFDNGSLETPNWLGDAFTADFLNLGLSIQVGQFGVARVVPVLYEKVYFEKCQNTTSDTNSNPNPNPYSNTIVANPAPTHIYIVSQKSGAFFVSKIRWRHEKSYGSGYGLREGWAKPVFRSNPAFSKTVLATVQCSIIGHGLR